MVKRVRGLEPASRSWEPSNDALAQAPRWIPGFAAWKGIQWNSVLLDSHLRLTQEGEQLFAGGQWHRWPSNRAGPQWTGGRHRARLAPGDAHRRRIERQDGCPGHNPLSGASQEAKLLYAKAVLPADASWDLLAFKAREGRFPNHSTGQQMFTDEQFEAYRSLGYDAGCRAAQLLNIPETLLRHPAGAANTGDGQIIVVGEFALDVG